MYISAHPDEPSSKEKSRIILRTLQENSTKLIGTVCIGGSYEPNKYNEPAKMLKKLKNPTDVCVYFPYGRRSWNGKWLYTDSLQLVSHTEISKHDLILFLN